jgi:Uma2 family endonuclease
MAVAERVRPHLQRFVEEPQPYTSAEFAQIAALYSDLRIELTREGELILMPPTFTETGMRNFRLTVRFGMWSEANHMGFGADSSTIWTLPNGAKRSPDLSWVTASRWNALTEDERKDFSLVCPDFVVELRSKTDRLSTVQKKMREYMENGAKLGWLIDPISRRVEIYRPGLETEVLDSPASLSGEDVLPGLTLSLAGILD